MHPAERSHPWLKSATVPTPGSTSGTQSVCLFVCSPKGHIACASPAPYVNVFRELNTVTVYSCTASDTHTHIHTHTTVHQAAHQSCSKLILQHTSPAAHQSCSTLILQLTATKTRLLYNQQYFRDVPWLRRFVSGISTSRSVFDPRPVRLTFIVHDVTMGQVLRLNRVTASSIQQE